MTTAMMTPMKSQEEPLLPRIAAGEEGALEACFDRYRGLVWSLARRSTGSAEDAEDAVQEVLLRLWKSAHRFDPSLSSEKNFVALLTKRHLIDQLRRRDRRVETEPLAAADSAVCPARDLDQVDAGEEAGRVRDAIGRIGAERGRILEWTLCQGWTHREVAAHTGASLGTVKSHARRGRIHLLEMLADEEPHRLSA